MHGHYGYLLNLTLSFSRLWRWRETAIYLSAWAENNDMNIVIWTDSLRRSGPKRNRFDALCKSRSLLHTHMRNKSFRGNLLKPKSRSFNVGREHTRCLFSLLNIGMIYKHAVILATATNLSKYCYGKYSHTLNNLLIHFWSLIGQKSLTTFVAKIICFVKQFENSKSKLLFTQEILNN